MRAVIVITRHLLPLPLLLLFLVLAISERGLCADLSSDDYLTGYIRAILEEQLGWDRTDYGLDIQESMVTIKLSTTDHGRRERALDVLQQIKELEGLHFEVLPMEPSETESVQPATNRLFKVFHLSRRTTRFPAGTLFKPLMADPKQPRFYISVRRYDTDVESIASAAVGYGENFGLLRYQGIKPNDGLQFSIDGGLFAQFNLDEDSKDLVNSDFTIGFPLTYRHGPYSGKLRLYHQSSHLGDEFLLRAKPERVNLSFESIELLGALDWRSLRFYLGGEYLIHREPDDLDRAMLHGGLEYYGGGRVLGSGRLLAGLDLKSFDEHDWSVDASVNVGLHFGERGLGGRYLRLMAEGYKGFAPHGQFYNDRVSYVGLNLSFGL